MTDRRSPRPAPWCSPSGGDEGENGDPHGGQGDDDANDGHDNEDQPQAGCDATKLIAGAVVSEAELAAAPAGLVFEKIELVG